MISNNNLRVNGIFDNTHIHFFVLALANSWSHPCCSFWPRGRKRGKQTSNNGVQIINRDARRPEARWQRLKLKLDLWQGESAHNKHSWCQMTTIMATNAFLVWLIIKTKFTVFWKINTSIIWKKAKNTNFEIKIWTPFSYTQRDTPWLFHVDILCFFSFWAFRFPKSEFDLHTKFRGDVLHFL